MTTLKKGDKAPNFSGLDQDGQLHQLADYAGKKLVVFFYPKANTRIPAIRIAAPAHPGATRIHCSQARGSSITG